MASGTRKGFLLKKGAMKRRTDAAAAAQTQQHAVEEAAAQSQPQPSPAQSQPQPAPPVPPSIMDTGDTGLCPASANSVDGPNSSESPPALPRSIRCRASIVPKIVDMSTGKKPHKRGVVVGTKTQYMIKANGCNQLKVSYADHHAGPTSKVWRSLLSRDFQSYIKSQVPMKAPTYWELPAADRDIVSKSIETNYDIPASELHMWNFIDLSAYDRYKDWKCNYHAHYLKYDKDVPLELLTREEEWKYLIGHFEDPEYLKLCERNKANRNAKKEKAINHYCGSLALSYRVEEHLEKGHKAPHMAAFVDTFEPCLNAKDKVHP